MIRNLSELGPNLQKIIQRLCANQNLLKLLYYTDIKPLDKQDFTPEQIKSEIYNELIKIIPKVIERKDAKSVIALTVHNGIENSTNDEFVKINLSIEVFIPLQTWIIDNDNLRPFAILGEIQNSLNYKIINGLGRLGCGDFELKFLTDEISCYALDLSIIQYE